MSIDDALTAFADGVASRLRDILMAQSRWDAFVHDPEGGGAEPPLPGEDAGRLAAEMILRAIRAGVDPLHHAILRRLTRQEEVEVAMLMEQTGMSRVAMMETINDLAQVGLVSYSVERRVVRATDATLGLCALLDEAAERLARMVRERA